MTADINAPRRLLLGTVGWEGGAWSEDYYPDDIPPDWRLAYYANDCDCVMITARTWQGRDLDALAEQFAAAPDTLRCFLAMAAADAARLAPLLDALGPERGVILTAHADASFDRLPQWVTNGGDRWRDVDSDAMLLRWSDFSGDLRTSRVRAEALDAAATALVVDGPGASPAAIQPLRTLLELLGRA